MVFITLTIFSVMNDRQ